MESTQSKDLGEFLSRTREKRQRLIEIANKYIKAQPITKDLKKRCSSQPPIVNEFPGPSTRGFKSYKHSIQEQINKLTSPKTSYAESKNNKKDFLATFHSKGRSTSPGASIQEVIKDTYLNALPKINTKMLEMKPIGRIKRIKIPEPILKNKSVNIDLSLRSENSPKGANAISMTTRLKIKKQLLFPVLATAKHESFDKVYL